MFAFLLRASLCFQTFLYWKKIRIKRKQLIPSGVTEFIIGSKVLMMKCKRVLLSNKPIEGRLSQTTPSPSAVIPVYGGSSWLQLSWKCKKSLSCWFSYHGNGAKRWWDRSSGEARVYSAPWTAAVCRSSFLSDAILYAYCHRGNFNGLSSWFSKRTH